MVDASTELAQVLAVTEEETAAIEAGDIHRYLSLISDDAVFMPPNAASKTGQNLRQWLGDFLDHTTIRYVQFVHGDTIIRGDLACHAYTCSWSAASKSGAQPALMFFKGMHVLRRQPGGAWKIARSIWNVDPAPAQSHVR